MPLRLIAALLLLAACATPPAALPVSAPAGALIVDIDRQPDETVRLWPAGPPGGVPDGLVEHYVERTNPFGLRDRAVLDVTDPTLSIFRPDNPDGSAILIIPGGGYKWVVVEKEGYEGARWFSRRGATVYVMSYRRRRAPRPAGCLRPRLSRHHAVAALYPSRFTREHDRAGSVSGRCRRLFGRDNAPGKRTACLYPTRG